MSGVNKVILIGRLGADPVSRSMQNGGDVVSFSLATSENWTDKDGEKREKTEWHNVVIFNEGLAKVAAQYLRKGSAVYVEGQLQTRKWQDRDGNDKYTTEVVLQKFRGGLTLLGGKADGDSSDTARDDRAGARTAKRPAEKGGRASDYGDDLDDDVPF